MLSSITLVVHVVDSGSRLGCDLEPPVAPPGGSLVRARLPCLNVLCEMLARTGVEPVMEDHHVRAGCRRARRGAPPAGSCSWAARGSSPVEGGPEQPQYVRAGALLDV
jgi:hypothetical protein